MKWALLLAIPILVVVLSLSGPHVSREITLSYFMISGTTATVGDIPVDHLLGLVALVLLTAAFLVKEQ